MRVADAELPPAEDDFPPLSVEAIPSPDRRGRIEPVLAPTDAKNQHFVPRGYLRAFEVEHNSSERQLLIVGADGQPIGHRSSKVVAASPHGYNVKTGNGALSIEDWLDKQIENPGIPLLRRLIDDPSAIERLSAEEEVIIARFIAAAMFRVEKRYESVDALAGAVARMKEMARGWAQGKMGIELGNKAADQWDKEPDHVWLGSDTPYEFAGFATNFLEGVQGWANLLLSMSWTCGRVPNPTLFTSDNPVSRFARPDSDEIPHGFTAIDYYVALAPGVLLVIGRWPADASLVTPTGPRAARNFTAWDAGVARNVIAADCDKEMYGEYANISKASAVAQMRRVARVVPDYGSWT